LELFLIKFYLLPAQSTEVVTAAWFLTLSITAYSQLFRRPFQCYHMRQHGAQILFPFVS